MSLAEITISILAKFKCLQILKNYKFKRIVISTLFFKGKKDKREFYLLRWHFLNYGGKEKKRKELIICSGICSMHSKYAASTHQIKFKALIRLGFFFSFFFLFL